MIKGMHALFYTPDPEAARAFIRDALGLPNTDTGGGWLIFDVQEADFGVHPGEGPRHEVSFYCDDIQATVAELTAKGVTFTTPISEQQWGFLTRFRIPGGLEVDLYQPKYRKEPGG